MTVTISKLATLAAAVTVAAGLSAATAQEALPRIEDFRLDLDKASVETARLANARSLATQAYLWGLPAFLHYRQTTEIKQGRSLAAPAQEPFGGWILLRKLATPDDKANVMPNVDTLYGAAYLLLDKQGPVVLSIPKVTDRYYSVALHDAYFNTFDVVGTRKTGGRAANILILPPMYDRPVPPGFDRVIRSPTAGVALFQRVFIRDASEMTKVQSIQDQIRLAPLASWKKTNGAFAKIETPEFDSQEPVRLVRDPLRYFEIVSAHTCRNPPTPSYAALVSAFRQIGIGPCETLPADPALRQAIAAGARDAQQIINARVSDGPIKNGWRVPDPNTGKESPDYTGRAVVQMTQIASFSPDEAMYFTGRLDKNGAPLDGRNLYTLTFPKGQLPPVDPRAFWSLTMYGAGDNLLVPNAIDRYVLRPTTPGLRSNPDGSLTLHISHQKPTDAPDGNWLPAPSGPFIVVLRTYMPSVAAQRGEWVPPPLVKQ